MPTAHPIHVQVANGDTLQSSHVTKIPLPLPDNATTAHIIPNLRHSLISVGKLCDHNCNVLFTRTHADIVCNGHPIATAQRDNNGLWSLASSPPHRALTMKANLQQTQSTTIRDHLHFLHAACFSPTTSTLIQAIQRNYLTTWPGLHTALIRKHLPKSPHTAKGHLDQQRKNTRSTRTSDNTDIPQQEPANTKTNIIFATILDPKLDTGLSYSDLTGRFPVQSSRGNNYILALYDYDSNAILVEPLRNRQDTTILAAYQKSLDTLRRAGCPPKVHRLDNEASKLLKSLLSDNNIDYQLTPAHIHRRNAAERAIRTFKNHFIAGLCSVAPDFPMHLWDHLLPQAQLTLNLLRPSRINPALSAHAQLFGAFDYNRTPLAPPGMRCVAHEKPHQRTSWSPHGVDAWYVGPALEHYRCFKVYIPTTRATRTIDTLDFFPHNDLRTPFCSPGDAVIRAAHDLTHALRQPPHGPLLNLGTLESQALQQLSEIFQQALPANNLATPPPEPVYQTSPPRVEDSSDPPRVEPRRSQRLHAAPVIAPTYRPQDPILLQPELSTDILQHDVPLLASNVIDQKTGAILNYRDLIHHADPTINKNWNISSANEFGRLAQGIGNRVKGTDTIFFIPRSAVPADRTVTYARFVCAYRPQKSEPNRTRMTVGGNLIDYPGDVSTRTADLTTVKAHLNSTVSTPGAKYLCADVKNFYLGTPMWRWEYMRIHISDIPDEVIKQYNLHAIKDTNGYIYVEIRKGMYGLPQAGILANKLLEKRLSHHGYYPTKHTPGFWRHKTRPISFCLVVDDFGIQYVGREHAHHLLAALKENYEITIDWEATLYLGITLTWDYIKRTVDLSMPGYVTAALKKFNHPKPARPEHAPYRHVPPQYGKPIQLTDPIDTSPPLQPSGIKFIQQVVGTFLYYARAVDNTMLTALSTLSSAQSKGTEATADALVKFLNYCATHPDAVIRFHASDMLLRVHSDTSYLSEPKARSRAGGYFYLGDKPPKPDKPNGPILVTTGVIRVVVSSAAEAETGGLFSNMKEAVILRTTLDEMGHPQPSTPIQVDNSTACGIANDNIRQQRSRAIDMRFYWVRDRTDQKQFHVFWAPGSQNLADYFTKHHTAAHHQRMRPVYLHMTHLATLTSDAHSEGVLKLPNTSLASIESFRDCARQLAALLALRRETFVSPARRSARCELSPDKSASQFVEVTHCS